MPRGEWYYTDSFTTGTDLGNPSAQDWVNRRSVITALLGAIPPTRSLLVRTPAIKRSIVSSSTAVTQTEAQASPRGMAARIGFHNDCFLADPTDYGTYANVAVDYPFVGLDSKWTPSGGETCSLNKPRSSCPTALSEMAMFHFSYLNNGYHPDVLASWKNDGCLETIKKRLGYRFQLLWGDFPTSVTAGQTLSIKLNLTNVGFASAVNSRPVVLVLRNDATSATTRVDVSSTSVDPRMWLPGTSLLQLSIPVPATTPGGTYSLLLHLPDAQTALATRPEFAVQLANTGTWEAAAGFNNLLAKVAVTAGAVRAGLPEAAAPQSSEGQASPAVYGGVGAGALALATAAAVYQYRRRNSHGCGNVNNRTEGITVKNPAVSIPMVEKK